MTVCDSSRLSETGKWLGNSPEIRPQDRFPFSSCNQHILPHNAGHFDTVLSSESYTGFVGTFGLSLGGHPPGWCGSGVGNVAVIVLVSPKEPTPPDFPDLPSIEGRKTIVRSRLLHIRTRSEHIVSLL